MLQKKVEGGRLLETEGRGMVKSFACPEKEEKAYLTKKVGQLKSAFPKI